MKKLRVLDLFSGIGGFSLGLERTGGFETVAFCEINPYASEVLKQWWPDVPNIKGGVYALNSLLKRARTFSLPASRVRTFLLQDGAPDLPAPVRDSFGHSCEPFAWFDQKSRSWKTWQRCLVEGWETFSDTWPRSGMTRNGIAYRRPPLVPLTEGTESGSLLPTTTASQYGSNKSASSGAAVRPSLAAIARLPTPTASLGTKGGRVTPRKGREGETLIEAVAARRFATPNTADAKGGTRKGNGQVQLCHQVGGSLNPTWVEWLMGFPLGWTDLGASATPLSRKLSNSSAKPSLKRKG